ncbi:glycoside hydrolase family 43 protein [Dichomitus squalens]|uniref:Arabinan endo-1,5-alpha-L-arabinosidase n=1 Tax=Dichomitus squalens TaxID=114155 RepID=A0A4Q9MRK1_9APHY|nr:glycoside hydrolase family 43 protein [Dichomitus squalens]
MLRVPSRLLSWVVLHIAASPSRRTMKLSFLESIISLVTCTLAQTPNPLPGSSDTVVRDPAIYYNGDSKKYFVFSTDNDIGIFTSTSLLGPWTSVGSVLPNCSTINLSGNCDLWAPDINFVNGQYVLYYLVSTVGSQDSAIGVATSPSMEPGTWTDLGAVVTSADGDNYNAIDPNLFVENSQLKLGFGSYWGCVFQVPLNSITSSAEALPGTHLAGYNGRRAEGSFTYKPASSPYYFEFFSDGITPFIGDTDRPPAGQEYKVLVGRGSSPSGPFVDQSGNDITLNLDPPSGNDITLNLDPPSGNDITLNLDPPSGTLVLGSHDNVYAPGGQSLFFDPVSGRDVIAYHYVPNDAFGGPSYLGINYVDFSSGWLVIVD